MIAKSRGNRRWSLCLCCISVGLALIYLIHGSARGQIPPPSGGMSVSISPQEQTVAVGEPANITISYSVVNPPAAQIGAPINWGDGSSGGGFITNTNGSPIDLEGTVAASHAYSQPGVYTIEVTLMDVSAGGEAYVTATATVAVTGNAVTITAEAIDQDDPTNTKWAPAPAVVYGGTIPSTADNLRLSRPLRRTIQSTHLCLIPGPLPAEGRRITLLPVTLLFGIWVI